MKKVSLIGDSIRIGYQAAVSEALDGRAEIWAPEGNCMHSVHHLFNLQPWYLDPAADVIHVNFGLWDCRRLGLDSTENAVPVEVFTRNLDFILRKVRAATSAPIVWATITPVVQVCYNARFSHPYDPCRVAADVERYNAAAASILVRHGVLINDLHAFVECHGRERMICEDGIHYTDEGCCLLAEQVTQVISRFL